MSAHDSIAQEPSRSTRTAMQGPGSTPDITAQAAVKPRRARVIRPDLEDVDQMCVRILAFIKSRGDRVTASQVRRGTNAYRHPQIYEAAIQKLTDIGAIEVEEEPGSRRRWIRLLKIPKRLQATRLKPKRRRHRPRSRGRNPSFELLLAKRSLEKVLEVLTDNLRKSREETRRRARRAALAAILVK